MLLTDLMSALQQGKQLANSATWKNRSIATGALTAFLVAGVAVAKGLGYELPVDNETLGAIAGGVAAVVGLLLSVSHAATSTTVGLPPKDPPADPPGM